MNVYEKIAAQQKGKEHTDVWMVGQQLRDLLRADPTLEEIVDTDLDLPQMSLMHCAGKIKARADELHKTMKGNCVCISPDEAERIIRRFYGLPESGAAPEVQAAPALAAEDDEDALDFGDFL